MDTKIENISLKRILKWVSKTDYTGFGIPDIKKGMELKRHQQPENIFGFLKQEKYIEHIGGLSPLYRKTSKVISELNSIKSWYEKPAGLIIVGIAIVIVGAIILKYTGLDANEIKNYIIIRVIPQ